MASDIQWMTFENPKLDWQHNNHCTVYGKNGIVDRCGPPLLSTVYCEKSFFVAYKMALEEGLTCISYSSHNISDRKYKLEKSVLNLTQSKGTDHVKNSNQISSSNFRQTMERQSTKERPISSKVKRIIKGSRS